MTLFRPRKQFNLAQLDPGVKCFVCQVFLSSKKEREEHLASIHKINQNSEILSFSFQQERVRIENCDLAAENEKKTLINSLDKKRKPKEQTENRENRRGKPLICGLCDRTFESYDHQAHQKHEEMHLLTLSTPSALPLPRYTS